MSALKAPFPYFGGKSRIASEVWSRLGSPARYVEPFAGSLAVLLARPAPWGGREVVNDSDGLLSNFWRAIAADPAAVAAHADWPAAENDLHARHAWLVGQRDDITRQLEGDPAWYDAKAAGWWVWGIGLWIGGGWCSGDGPWRVVDRQLLHAGDDGRGIHRQLLHAGDDGQGIHRQRREQLVDVFAALSGRLRDALVMCGDWTRVVTPAVLLGSGKGRSGNEGACAIFLDPPYADTADRTAGLYAHDSDSVAHDVREWAIANGNDPRLRIALAGYDGEHVMPDSWSMLEWTSRGGYSGQGSETRASTNRRRERVWFSPHCRRVGLWDVLSDPENTEAPDSGGATPVEVLR